MNKGYEQIKQEIAEGKHEYAKTGEVDIYLMEHSGEIITTTNPAAEMPEGAVLVAKATYYPQAGKWGVYNALTQKEEWFCPQ